jgi:hypothetical protein
LVQLWVVLAAGAATAAPRWEQIAPSSGLHPPGRTQAGSIYDPIGQRFIVFGGKSSGGNRNDVWAYDLRQNRWTELSSAAGAAPAPRFTPNAVYDPAGYQMIVWSGQSGGGFHNDVWAFDLASHQWSEFTPSEPRPNIRYGAASVFDPLERDLVTFAGFTDQGRFEDTWRFGVEPEAWREIETGAANPHKRCLHSASYDPSRHRMMIYGGQRSGPLGDLWAFDLASDSWSELTPASRPPGRYFTAQAYAAQSDALLIFGGNLGAGRSNEVWAFDLGAGSWRLLNPAGAAPSARDGAAAAWIPEQNRLLVFGGFDGAYRSDLWSLEGLIADLSECGAGNVNAGAGEAAGVLSINGSMGAGEGRRVTIGAATPLEIRIEAPPAMSSGPTPFVLYAWVGSPTPSTVRMLPYELGPICMPAPLSGGAAPQPVVIWNNIGLEELLGAPLLGSQPAPSVVLDLPAGLGFSGTFFLQGIVVDGGSPSGIAAVTNGITLVVE